MDGKNETIRCSREMFWVKKKQEHKKAHDKSGEWYSLPVPKLKSKHERRWACFGKRNRILTDVNDIKQSALPLLALICSA